MDSLVFPIKTKFTKSQEFGLKIPKEHKFEPNDVFLLKLSPNSNTFFTKPNSYGF